MTAKLYLRKVSCPKKHFSPGAPLIACVSQLMMISLLAHTLSVNLKRQTLLESNSISIANAVLTLTFRLLTCFHRHYLVKFQYRKLKTT